MRTCDRNRRLLSRGSAPSLSTAPILPRSSSPTLFYFSNIVLHIALGIALAIGGVRLAGAQRATTQSKTQRAKGTGQ